jgi:hypothetical protein
MAAELPRSAGRPHGIRRRYIHDEGGCECQHAGTFADTVTGSTGAEVIALGTVIGIIGAKATKPG